MRMETTEAYQETRKEKPLSSLISNDSDASPMTEFFQANAQPLGGPSSPSLNPSPNSSPSNWLRIAVPIIAIAALGLVQALAVHSRRERTHDTVQH
ncbi:hypothetical protein E6H33_04790 [Candidatus Bathyarchaeota archaeon]|nr:MAG: hypothetical protein E6H33_04790 [Candidatus Bathyarchaeota archaeon]